MTEVDTPAVKSRIIMTAERDLRIVGVVDYGPICEGRADKWSDVDVALFLRDADCDDFERGWKGRAAQFGPLLLAPLVVCYPPAKADTLVVCGSSNTQNPLARSAAIGFVGQSFNLGTDLL